MAYIAECAPSRRPSPFVSFLANLRLSFTAKPQFPKDLSDHLARDVGLSAHDLEVLRYEHPSQSVRHPML